jgi:hypothetical protein
MADVNDFHVRCDGIDHPLHDTHKAIRQDKVLVRDRMRIEISNNQLSADGGIIRVKRAVQGSHCSWSGD